MDRPVVDQTGLKGGYQLIVAMSPPSDEGGGRKGSGPPEGGGAGGDVPGPRPDRFADPLFAVLERAGLKLEKTKAPIEIIVVDHIEKTPTEN